MAILEQGPKFAFPRIYLLFAKPRVVSQMVSAAAACLKEIERGGNFVLGCFSLLEGQPGSSGAFLIFGNISSRLIFSMYNIETAFHNLLL